MKTYLLDNGTAAITHLHTLEEQLGQTFITLRDAADLPFYLMIFRCVVGFLEVRGVSLFVKQPMK